MSELGEKCYLRGVRVDKLEALLRSMIADIEAMHDAEEWFGPFEVDTVVGGQAYIYWPNLKILLEEAKTKLEEQ